jgi:hypothetical protein
MDLFRINTTAFEDEDFILLTDLSAEQIKKVITPIVLKERQSGNEEDFYDNDDLTNALIEAYPDAIVQLYTDEFETITI